MKYYIIEIVDGDSKVKGKSINEYDNRQDALASFHKKLGIALGSELYKTEQILCIDSDNGILAMEKVVSDKYTEPQTEVVAEEVAE